MDETKQTAETGSEEGGDQRQQQIVDMGSSTIRTERGTIHTLTIVGQIEGHQVLPSSAKTTKYEHVMPCWRPLRRATRWTACWCCSTPWGATSRRAWVSPS